MTLTLIKINLLAQEITNKNVIRLYFIWCELAQEINENNDYFYINDKKFS